MFMDASINFLYACWYSADSGGLVFMRAHSLVTPSRYWALLASGKYSRPCIISGLIKLLSGGSMPGRAGMLALFMVQE